MGSISKEYEATAGAEDKTTMPWSTWTEETHGNKDFGSESGKDGYSNPAFTGDLDENVMKVAPETAEPKRTWSPGGKGDPFRSYRFARQAVLVTVWICIVSKSYCLCFCFFDFAPIILFSVTFTLVICKRHSKNNAKYCKVFMFINVCKGFLFGENRDHL